MLKVNIFIIVMQKDFTKTWIATEKLDFNWYSFYLRRDDLTGGMLFRRDEISFTEGRVTFAYRAAHLGSYSMLKIVFRVLKPYILLKCVKITVKVLQFLSFDCLLSRFATAGDRGSADWIPEMFAFVIYEYTACSCIYVTRQYKKHVRT